MIVKSHSQTQQSTIFLAYYSFEFYVNKQQLKNPTQYTFKCNSSRYGKYGPGLLPVFQTTKRKGKSDFFKHHQLRVAMQVFTFLMLASPFMTRQSSRSSSSSSSSMGQLCWSRKKHLVPSFRGSKGSTIMGSVPLISQRQNGQPWPSDSWNR